MKLRIYLAAAVAVLIAALAWRFYRTDDRVVRGRAVDRREIALRGLGEFLATQPSARQALIIANPFSRASGQPGEVYAFEQAAVRGLKAGWGDQVRLLGIAYPELSAAAQRDPASVPLPSDATTPLSFLTAERAWDALFNANPEAEVFVSLIGLPANVASLEVWRRPKPRFALLLPDLRLIGEPPIVKAAFQSGKILAAVLNRPGAPPESGAIQANFRAEFDARFLLVTEANAEEMLQAFPNLFGP